MEIQIHATNIYSSWDLGYIREQNQRRPALRGFPPSRETHVFYPAWREVIKTSGKVKRRAG